MTTYVNKFKSTEIRGGFKNTNNLSEPAYAKIEGTLELGLQTTTYIQDEQTGTQVAVYNNTGGDIVFFIGGTQYTLSRQTLSRLVNINADVQNQIDAKPSMNYLNTQIAGVENLISELDILKVDKATLDTVATGLQSQIDDKVSSSTLASTLSDYVNKSSAETVGGAKTFSLFPKVGGTGDPMDDRDLVPKKWVDDQILYLDSTKASEQYVNSQIAAIDTSMYATTQYVDNAVANVQVDLTGYATETYVNSAVAAIDLSPYATTQDLTTGLAGKVDNGTYNTAIDGINTALSGKASNQALTDGLAGKVDNTTYTTAIDGINTALSGKASNQALTDGLAAKVDTTTYTTAINGINTALDGKAADSAVVKLTGDQSISGAKAFQAMTATTFSTSSLTMLNGNTLQVNPGACFVNDAKGFNMMGGNTVYYSTTTGSNEVAGVYRDPAANGGSLVFTQNYGTSQGGGFQFHTRDRTTGTGGTLALNVQHAGITASLPFTFSGSAPSCTTTPTLVDHLTRKGYVDTAISDISTTQQSYTDGQLLLCAKLSGNNAMSGNNTFSGTNTFSNNATFSGATTTFNGTNLAFGTGTPVTVTPTQMGYLSTLTSNVQIQLNARPTASGTNTWTGVNTFNQLPRSSAATWDLPAQLGTRDMCDARYATLDGGNLYTASGTQTFSGAVSFGAAVSFVSSTAAISCAGTNIIAGNLAHLSGSSSNIQTQLNGKAGLGSNNTFTGTQTINNTVAVSVNGNPQISLSNPNAAALGNTLKLYVMSTAGQFLPNAAASDAAIIGGSSNTAGNMAIGLWSASENGLNFTRSGVFVKSPLACNYPVTFANSGESYIGGLPTVASLGTKLLANSNGTELLMVRLTIPANTIKSTVYRCPVSVFRSGTMPAPAATLIHTHRLDSIVSKIYNDSGVFLGNATVSVSGSTLGVTSRSMSSQLLTTWSYEQYWGRATITYQFPNTATATVYRIQVIVSETYSYYSGGGAPTATSAGYYFNTALATTSGTGMTFNDASPSGYAVSSISLITTVNSVPEAYGDETGAVGASALISKDLNVTQSAFLPATTATSLTVNQVATLPTTTATSLTVSGDAKFNGNVVMKSAVGCYLLNGSGPYDPVPIFSSLKSISPDNADDQWVVMPGYKLDLYRDLNYVTFQQTVDNTNGTTPISAASLNPNSNSSCRLYYAGVEVTLSPLS